MHLYPHDPRTACLLYRLFDRAQSSELGRAWVDLGFLSL